MIKSIKSIQNFKRVHMVGIKGVGMTSLAQILQGRGIKISGSDVSEHFFTEEVLQEIGIPYTQEFSKSIISDELDAVLYSTAYNPEENEELLEAQKKNIPIISYPECLGLLSKEMLSIAVFGTHGKTTTSALLARAMEVAGVDPSAIIGSKVQGWQGGARNGRGEYFIFEADEYQNKLAFYSPWSAILTSVDWDHPDYFKTQAEYERVFIDFTSRVPSHGHLIINGDDSDVLRVCEGSSAQMQTYGFSKDNHYRIENYELRTVDHQGFQSFKIRHKNEVLGPFELQIPGKHNVMNATAAIALCHELKIDIEKVADGIKNFQGTARRFEYIGEYNKAVLIDDYAHHPREITATLEAAKNRYQRMNIIAIFQPHTFSRTEALFEEFSQCFEDADKVYVLDVYGSAREAVGNVSGQGLADNINKYQHGKAQYSESVDVVVEELQKEIGKNDVVVSMGAGNVWEVTHKLSGKV